MTRTQRRNLIADLLRSGPARSQEAIANILQAKGAAVTQATISRDLAFLGAVKGRDGYHLPEAPISLPTPSAGELESIIRRYATAVLSADSLVVIRTAPGHAMLIGTALDRWRPAEAMGTIAGDDTIFIATLSRASAARLAQWLSDSMEGAAA